MMTNIKVASIAFLLLTGCVTQTSPERHSLYFARHDPTMVGGNYISKPTYTAKANLPTYQRVYKEGQEDKVKGLTVQQANQVADEIYQAAVKTTKVSETFVNSPEHKMQNTADAQSMALWGKTLKETYLDGYNGIK